MFGGFCASPFCSRPDVGAFILDERRGEKKQPADIIALCKNFRLFNLFPYPLLDFSVDLYF